MSQSLSEKCTPLKREYDSCFNAWFAEYLEPPTAVSPEKKREQDLAKTEEYEQRCGKVWAAYRQCVQQAVKEKGLDQLLDQARLDNPLTEPPPPPDVSSKSN